MLETKAYDHSFKRTIDLRGCDRFGTGATKLRLWLHLYEVDAYKQPEVFPIAIQRSREVRKIIREYYPIESNSIDLQSWAKEACSDLDEILPDLGRSLTHFLDTGIELNGKDQSFFKTYLNLNGGRRSSTRTASQIGGFIFQYCESHIILSPECLIKPQSWILDCLLAQWRLLKSN